MLLDAGQDRDKLTLDDLWDATMEILTDTVAGREHGIFSVVVGTFVQHDFNEFFVEQQFFDIRVEPAFAFDTACRTRNDFNFRRLGNVDSIETTLDDGRLLCFNFL